MNIPAVLLALGASVIGALGAVFLKRGASKTTFSYRKIYRNRSVGLGVILYGFSLLIFVFALRFENVSLLYPMVATAYIWIGLFSKWFLKEKMNSWKWIGVLMIVLGIVLIGVR
ncbi:MAG TPA: EamA family transporter [Candidatus Nanoarchaeia archaeon]|nr:EamA family transporter [Candidatus Nanoarchaeia archaeon]